MSTHPPVINPEERRFFIYSLLDASGACLYVGRSSNVAKRIRAHCSEAAREDLHGPRKALWLADVRSVAITGPYSYAAAVALERRAIESERPHGNLALAGRTVRDEAMRARARAAA